MPQAKIMAIFLHSHKGTRILLIANVIFCCLTFISPGNIFALDQDLEAIEAKRAAITELISKGETDRAINEYENLVAITEKEDLALLQNIMSVILKKKSPLTIAVWGNLKDHDAVPFVVEALKGRDGLVAKSAAEALQNFNDDTAISSIIEVAICHSDDTVRDAALKTLVYYKDNGLLNGSHVPVFLTSLQSCIDIEDAPLSSAVKILGELGDTRAVPVLLDLLEQTTNPIFRDYPERVSKEIANSLNLLGDYNGTAALIKLLDRGNEKQRIKAALAAGALGDKRTVPSLLQALEDERASEEVRVSAAQALSALGAMDAVPVLREALGYKSGRIREQSAVALYGLGEKQIFPTIIQEMTVNRSSLDSVIAGLRNEFHAIPLLLQILETEDLPARYYIGAAAILAETGDKRAVPPLMEVLKDYKSSKSQARESAATALGNLGDERAVPALIDAADIRDDMKLSKAALEALAKLGDSQASSALIRDLEDEEGLYLRGDEVINVSSGLHLVTHEDKDTHRGAIAATLGKLGDTSAVPILLKCLANKRYYKTRLKTAEALGALGDIRAVPALMKVVEEEDLLLRKEAAMALAKLGDKRAISLLIESFAIDTDDNDRMDIVQGITEFGHTAIPTLISSLESDNALIRTWSAQTIGEIYSKTTASLTDDLVKNTPFGASKGPNRKTDSEELKDKSSGELKTLLSSNNTDISIQTTGFLMNLEDNSAIPDMQAALDDNLLIKGTTPQVRMKDEKGIVNLKDQLKNETPLVQSKAGELKKLSDVSGTPILEENINDLNPKVKDYTAAIMGDEAGLHEALKVLRKRLGSESLNNVQVASAEALWRIVNSAE